MSAKSLSNPVKTRPSWTLTCQDYLLRGQWAHKQFSSGQQGPEKSAACMHRFLDLLLVLRLWGDAGVRRVLRQELWPLLPFPTRTSAPSPSTPDAGVTLPFHLCQTSPTPSNLEPCKAGENFQYSPGLHLTIICPHPRPSPTSSEPEETPILVSNPRTRPRPQPHHTCPHLQNGQDVEHGVGLAAAG